MSELKKLAIELYKPPFRHIHGYIYDADSCMVADDSALRVRGWGRIQYMDDAEALQDAAGELIAEALTEYWQRRTQPEATAPAQAVEPQPVAEQGEQRVDDIVTALYRRFKDWSKRGFGPDDVTWCEVKADVMALIAASQQAAEPFGWVQFIDGVQTQNFARDEKELATVKAIAATMRAPGKVEYVPVYAAPAIQQPQDGATIATIREAVLAYYDDLSSRKHGGVAQDKAFSAIQEALGMSWHFGVDHSAAITKPNADCSGDPKSCPDNEGYGCACDPMNKAARSAS